MAKKLSYFICINILYATCQVTITRIQEFYNPTLNQTVILAGDLHVALPTDSKQEQALIDLLTAYKPYAVIEAASDKCLLANILFFVKAHNIAHHNPEFRTGIKQLMHIVLQSIETYQTFDAIQAQWSTNEMKRVIYNAFMRSCKDAKRIINKLERYKQILQTTTNDSRSKNLIDYLEKLLSDANISFNEISQPIADETNQHHKIDKCISFLLKNIFIDNKDNTTMIIIPNTMHKIKSNCEIQK